MGKVGKVNISYAMMMLVTCAVVMFTSTCTLATDTNQYAICENTVHGEREYISYFTPEYTIDKIYVGITEDDYRESMTSFGIRQGLYFNTVPDELICEDKAVKAIGDHIMRRYDNDFMRANAVAFLIQSAVRYESDEVIYGVEEYWARPLETIYHCKGDCEDTAVFVCSVCRYMGIKAILLESESHIGSAVCIDTHGFYFEYDGDRYYNCQSSDSYPPKWLGERNTPDLKVIGDKSHYMYYLCSFYKTIGDRVEYLI